MREENGVLCDDQVLGKVNCSGMGQSKKERERGEERGDTTHEGTGSGG